MTDPAPSPSPESRTGRPEGRPLRFRHVMAAVVATALLTGTVAAYAVDRFSDVPNTNPFHDEITWMADTGISTGFPDGTYRPAENVSRQAMSAFMQRLFNLHAGLVAARSYTTQSFWSTDGWRNAGHPSDSGAVVTIPPGTTGRILAIFSLEGSCDAGNNIIAVVVVAPTCEGRITVNGTVQGGAQALMYSDHHEGYSQGTVDLLIQNRTATMQRLTATLPAGTYTVRGQIQGVSGGATGNNRTQVNQRSAVVSAQVLLDPAS